MTHYWWVQQKEDLQRELLNPIDHYSSNIILKFISIIRDLFKMIASIAFQKFWSYALDETVLQILKFRIFFEVWNVIVLKGIS